MDELTERLDRIECIYKKLSQDGFDKWLKNIEPYTECEVWMKMPDLPTVYTPYYQCLIHECLQIGRILKNIEEQMRMLKTLQGTNKRLYEEYKKKVEAGEIQNPDILKWLEDYEKYNKGD